MRIIINFVIFIAILSIAYFSTYGWRFTHSANIIKNESSTKLANQLKQHVYQLSHIIGERSVYKYDKLNAAADYITQQFKSFGYQVKFQHYTYANKMVKNIVVTKTGSKNPHDIIIVGAHYDTFFNPGADDNASGIAALLELAKIMAHKKTNQTIKFIAFVNEEPPMFKTDNMGSRVYAKAARAKNEKIKAVIIFEMIGAYSEEKNSQRYPPFFGPFYPNRGNFITVVSNFRSRKLKQKIVSQFKQASQFPIESVATFGFIPGVDFSDHWSFWKEGFPAIMITDTAFYRYIYYHSNLDTHEKLNYPYLANVLNGLAKVLAQF